MSNTKAGPLSGVRILDFTWAAAGPQGTLLAGFLGAEVIKVESVRRLDLMRRGMSTLYEGFDNSPHLNDFNFNKLGIRLDLSKPEGQKLALSLVSVCDAAVDNFRPNVLERLGVGYSAMRRVNPSIILLSAANGGSTGPESKFAGYAGI
ncbi:MAG: CoA transferase, partial [Chloroflexota bacterium]